MTGAACDDPAQLHLRKSGDLRQAAQGEREYSPCAGQRSDARRIACEVIIQKNLIGDHRDAERFKPLQFVALHKRSGRIIRIDEHDRARTRSDRLLERIEIDVPSAKVAQWVLTY